MHRIAPASSKTSRLYYRVGHRFGFDPDFNFECRKRFYKITAPNRLYSKAGIGKGFIKDEKSGPTLKDLNENGNSIVVSGISGRFPSTDSMRELKENLMAGKDMVIEHTRWPCFTPPTPKRMGAMRNVDKFDGDFFGLAPAFSESMDPQQRRLLEVAFEAIFDAGINPAAIRNTKTGVYVGTTGGEAADYWLCAGALEEYEGYRMLGLANYIQANRISYALDLKGPSMSINTGCSASLVALEAAIHAMNEGTCDQAIVAGTTIHLNPTSTTEFAKLGALSPEGKCRSFDNEANGFVRSEAVVAVLIQRQKDAKRHYATVRGIRSSSEGFKKEGIVFPSAVSQEKLLRETYASVGIDPGQVSYFEAHGTGTPAGDPQELNAIYNVMCKSGTRSEPLLLGSTKSNLGHTESAAGLVGLAKVCIAIEEGLLPGNLHFKTPNSNAKEVFDGSIKVVDQNTPWKGGLVGLSSFGIGGTIVHLILESGPKNTDKLTKIPNKTRSSEEIPVLIPFSGRTKELVQQSLEEASQLASNPEAIGLLHQVFQTNIPGHDFRGYGLIGPGKDGPPAITIERVEAFEGGSPRPLWFIFPGMGSQWNEMGKELMKIDAYADSIQRSQITLKNAGLDLKNLLGPNNPSIFENIRDSLVAITAVQIALFDTLFSMGLRPDGFLGHSSGEILCAYADHCFSAEETLLVSEARGRAFEETKQNTPGGMASVGLSWEQAQARCSSVIFPACHNASENVSISGPLEEITRFSKKLQAEGIFARLVNTCGFAPHSQYVGEAHNLLIKYMEEIITGGGGDRLRSSKWVSSSVPEAEWDSELAKSSSAHYHANNLVSPVLFHEAVQKIPKRAVCIEIAPRGLFQPILRESLSTVISPMHHTVEDKLGFFLNSVGKMYTSGADNMNIGKLYPEVSHPVSADTPTISSLVKWEHGRSWTVPCVANSRALLGSTYKVELGKGGFSFLEGHKLDNRCVFPATGYLVQAWMGHAAANSKYYHEFPVTFENVCLERATFLKEDKPIKLKYSFFPGSNSFVIEEDGVTVIKGNTVPPEEDLEKRLVRLPPVKIPDNPERKSLNSDDIYKEFRLRGYNYSGEFRGIRNIDNEGKWAQVAWRGNWISFLDTILQTIVLSFISRNTAVPIRLKSVSIDPIKFYEYVKAVEEVDTANYGDSSPKKETLIPVSINSTLGVIQCPGIEFRGLTAMVIPRQKQKETLSIEEYNFIPYFDSQSKSAQLVNLPPVSLYSNVAGLIDLVLENTTPYKLKIIDIFENSENSFTETIANIINLKPKHTADITMLSTSTEIEKLDEKIKTLATTVLGKEVLIPDSGFVDIVLLDQPSLLEPVSEILQDNAHILLRSPIEAQGQMPRSLQLISQKTAEEATLTLFKKLPSGKVESPEVKFSIRIDQNNFDFLPTIQTAMAEAADEQGASNLNSRIYLYSQNDPHSGIIGLVKCLRLEPGGDKIRCIFDPQGSVKINFENPGTELKKIIEQDLVMNVIKDGKLGSYRHIPVSQNAAFPSKKVQDAYVNTLTTGDLTSLRWVESPLAYFDPQKDKVQGQGQVCTVHYAALNFRDIMLATGKLPVDSKTAFNPQDCVFGFEFSGVDSQKKRVMGMMASKAMASSVLIGPETLTWEIPEKWSLAEAATVPVVYSTAYYALYNRARIQNQNPNQPLSILIHSGTGGVGQAAINIAKELNCEIYTTVGTEEKRTYIKNLFPFLKPENIGSSRDCTFEQQIMELTKGRGVDIVLNSLADDKLQASVRCLAVHGKFLEIGAFDAFQNSGLGMECFLKNIEFHGIFLNHFLGGSQAEKDALGSHFLNGIKTGVVKPLSSTVFDKDHIEDAFRFMAGGKHMGKVLIEVLKEEKIGEKPSLMAVPRSYFSPDKSYVIIGGLGGMGLEVANWLVDRGAKHLVLTTRSGLTTGYQELCLRKWEEQGVKVEILKMDLASFDVAETLVQKLTADGKEIGGIFNSGLVLKDGPIEEQTIEDFEAVAAPKTMVTKNLDSLTRKYCQNLDYFVVFSSMSCGRGNVSQSNYGLANSVMEQICETRKNDGLHGLAIQWGVIGEVGAVAEKIFGAKLTGEEVFGGTLAQRIASCLDVLDMTLHQRSPIVSSLVLAENDSRKSKKAGLLETISHICGVKDMTAVSPDTKLVDLGMDSLIGMEIKQLIERDYDTPLTATELRSMTFNDLLLIEAGSFVKGQSKSQQKSVESGHVDLLDMLKGGTKTLVKLKSGAVADEEAPSKLFIVHGLDGHSSHVESLAELLNCEVFGFNFTPKMYEVQKNQLSIQSTAREYIKELKLVQPDGPYNIAGFSAGTSIAFEMALLLENELQDEVENMIVLDGICCWKKLENPENESSLIEGVIDMLLGLVNAPKAAEKALREGWSADDDASDVNLMANLLKVKNPNIDSSMVSQFFERTNALGMVTESYEPSQKLRGSVNLIKAKLKAHLLARVLDEDHYLQEYCEKPVTVTTVEGDHFSFLRPDQVTESANTINRILQTSMQNELASIIAC